MAHKIGDTVSARMLGVQVITRVTNHREQRGRNRYQLAIPENILGRLWDVSDAERAYINLSRKDGGFWYYATQIESCESEVE